MSGRNHNEDAKKPQESTDDPSSKRVTLKDIAKELA
jgi:hypothetical protein